MAALVLVQACGTTWRQPAEGLEPRTIPSRQQVQVWQPTRVDRWHGVSIADDSVAGIPYHQALDCTACRVALPRSAVDSIRFGNPEQAVTRTVLLGAGLLALLAIAWPSTTGD
jgi:hypothetical protein